MIADDRKLVAALGTLELKFLAAWEIEFIRGITTKVQVKNQALSVAQRLKAREIAGFHS